MDNPRLFTVVGYLQLDMIDGDVVHMHFDASGQGRDFFACCLKCEKMNWDRFCPFPNVNNKSTSQNKNIRSDGPLLGRCEHVCCASCILKNLSPSTQPTSLTWIACPICHQERSHSFRYPVIPFTGESLKKLNEGWSA